MIVDELQNADRYAQVQNGLAAGFRWLRQTDLVNLPTGKAEIDGDRLFAFVAEEDGKGHEQAQLEYHRKYLDIQYVVSGIDKIGWLAIADCQRTIDPFDAEDDLGFFYDRPDTWITLRTGEFAIFFPEDAHAPLAGSGPVKKVIVKVLLD